MWWSEWDNMIFIEYSNLMVCDTYIKEKTSYAFIRLLVFAFINKNGPGPRLSFSVEPPSFGIVSRKSPLLLPCSVNYTRDPSFSDDEGEDKDYDDVEENDDEGVNTHNYEDNPNFLLPHHINPDDFTEVKSSDDSSVINDEDNDAKDDSDDDFTGFRFRRHISAQSSLTHVWYRNGEVVVEGNHTFRIFPNGTLKIFYSDNTDGVYRCLVNDTKSNYGAIISRESSIYKTEFTRGSNESGVTVEIGSPIVLNCPFSSTPRANVTWSFKSKNIAPSAEDFHHQHDNRRVKFFQLQNGSLLIVNAKSTDSGKYKCVAKNEFLQKSERIFMPQVTVVASRSISSGLFPVMEEVEQKVLTGGTLRLFCVPYGGEAFEWTFTPRTTSSRRPIKLNGVKYELKYINVSREHHEGVYNCSTKTSYQIFNVTILIPPTFRQSLSSTTSIVAAGIKLNCSADGNPPPDITWYHNGRQVQNTHVVYYNDKQLRMNSIDPENAGIYQCFAKNDAGEIQMSAYLSLKKKKYLSRLSNVKCYPVNYTSVLVQFDSNEPIHVVNYYLATGNPYTWLAPRPLEVQRNNTIMIVGELKPLRAYTLYMRGLKKDHTFTEGKDIKSHMLMGRLSRGIKCATQGLEIFSTPFPSGIFIWWPHVKDLPIESLKIQFRHRDTKNPIVFSDQIIGTTCELDAYRPWEEIQNSLTKISAETKVVTMPLLTRDLRSIKETMMMLSHVENGVSDGGDPRHQADGVLHNETRTELLIPGNVTGILIPNSRKIEVRVLGATSDNPIDDKDLKYIPFKTIENSPDGVSQLRVNSVNSKSVLLSWNSFGPKNGKACLQLCFRNINHDVLIRGGKDDECRKINASRSSVEVKSLPPFTKYRMYLSHCNSTQPITEVIVVQTPQDVPGPVTKHRLEFDDGLTLHWTPPINPNGVLQYYSIVWSKDNVEMSANVTINENIFKFPNVTETDKIKITIRAVGSAGIGIPIYMNLMGEEDFKRVERGGQDSGQAKILGIVIGVFLSCICLICFALVFIRVRKCTKNRQNGVIENQTNIHDQSHRSCMRDTHEMQTLIPHTGLTTNQFVNTPNGNAKHAILDSFTANETKRENGQHIAVNTSPRVNYGPKTRNDRNREEDEDEEEEEVEEEEEGECTGNGSDRSQNTLKVDDICEPVKVMIKAGNINGNGNLIHMNGAIKTLIPQHSTSTSVLPPNQQIPINNNVKKCNTDHQTTNDTTLDSSIAAFDDADDSQQQLLAHSTPKLMKKQPNNRVADRCNDIRYHNGSNEILSNVGQQHNGIGKADDTFNWIVNVPNGKNLPTNDCNFRRPIVGPNG
ncbi:hypothetical protein DMENIID0001_118700 [Sergentomyia squamirostris]